MIHKNRNSHSRPHGRPHHNNGNNYHPHNHGRNVQKQHQHQPQPARKPKEPDQVDFSHQPYYDAGRDQQDQARYYANVRPNQSPQQLYRTLQTLVRDTHENTLGYDPDKYLYNWVDLRPDLRLESLYAKEQTGFKPVRTAKPEDLSLVSEGLSRKQVRTEVYKNGGQAPANLQQIADNWARAVQQGGTNAVDIAVKIAQIESQSFFNCEHVVPKIWFGDSQPMRGDLHHLFACNADSNSARSSRRFTELHGDSPLPNGEGWAPYRTNAFEPAGGKGAIARATFYFLLHYPSRIGDHATEYTPEDLKTLQKWSREDPPGLYERHRNQAIAQLQGNRNPFIDHPEWADRVDFTLGLGHLRPGAAAENAWPTERQRQ